MLGFVAGITTTLIGVGAKYLFDYRLDLRRLELQERAAVSDVMGNSLGQLQKSIVRLEDRIDSVFRDRRAVNEWLVASQYPKDDGYFLSSFAHRLFMFVAWSAIVQWAIDALPRETVRERADLRAIYEHLEQAKSCISTGLIIHESELKTDREGSVLFVGVIDEMADLGFRIHQANNKTIPKAAFDEEYIAARYPLTSVRRWLTLPDAIKLGPNNLGPAIILARLACLREVLDLIPVGTGRGNGRVMQHRLNAALVYAEGTLVTSVGLSETVPGKLQELLTSGGEQN